MTRFNTDLINIRNAVKFTNDEIRTVLISEGYKLTDDTFTYNEDERFSDGEVTIDIVRLHDVNGKELTPAVNSWAWKDSPNMTWIIEYFYKNVLGPKIKSMLYPAILNK